MSGGDQQRKELYNNFNNYFLVFLYLDTVDHSKSYQNFNIGHIFDFSRIFSDLENSFLNILNKKTSFTLN